MRIKTIILSIFYPNKWTLILATCLLLSNTVLFSQNITSPNSIYVRPFKKNGIFYSKGSVGFILKLLSNCAERQRGTVAIEIKNAVNGIVYHDNISLYINSKGYYTKDLNLGKLGLLSGIYTIYFNVTTNAGNSQNTTTLGKGTIYMGAGTLNAPRAVTYINPVNYGTTRQPFIQYGTASAGTTSPYTVVMPVTYTDTTYVIQATHKDTAANTLFSANPLSPSTFSIAWTGAVGFQSVYWTTFGT